MGQNAEFKANFGKLMERAKGKTKQVVQLAALEMASGMIEKTPVDTGRLKGNWFPGVGSADTSTTGASGSDSLQRVKDGLDGFEMGQKVFITNSLPYARVIELGLYGNPPGSANGPKTTGGFSRQAPAGMVRLTVQEFAVRLRKVVEQLK